MTLSPDAPLVDQITTPKLFRFSLTQANTDNRGFIVLDPFTAAADPTTGTSGSGSSSVRLGLRLVVGRRTAGDRSTSSGG